jgi:hypothetical protein
LGGSFRASSRTRRGPGEDAEGWLRKLSELDAREERLLDLYLEGELETDPYESRTSQLKMSRKTIEDELDRIEWTESDRDALLGHYAQIVPERLDALEPEERNRVYRMLDLTVLPYEDGNLEAKWVPGADLCRDNEPLLPGSCRTPGR